MSSLRSRWLVPGLTVAGVVLVGVILTSRLPTRRAPLTLRLELDKGSFSLKEESVRGKVYLSNRSRKPITITSEGCLWQHLHFRFFARRRLRIGDALFDAGPGPQVSSCH